MKQSPAIASDPQFYSTAKCTHTKLSILTSESEISQAWLGGNLPGLPANSSAGRRGALRGAEGHSAPNVTERWFR